MRADSLRRPAFSCSCTTARRACIGAPREAGTRSSSCVHRARLSASGRRSRTWWTTRTPGRSSAAVAAPVAAAPAFVRPRRVADGTQSVRRRENLLQPQGAQMADVVNIQPVVQMIASVLNGVDARLAVTSLQYVLCEAVRLQYDGQAG